MKRGVVMSIHKQHAVVMTANGQFLRAPIQSSPQIGEEITFEQEYKTPRTFKQTYWYASAAAVVLLLFIPILLLAGRDSHPVVAYLSMDINPSVEIGVDEQEKVRELHALNEDGKIIIEGLVYKGISVETVAASILERANGSHYMDTPNKDIFITSMLIDDGADLKLDYESMITGKVDQALRKLLNELAAEAKSANVTTLSIPNELREAAAANGISSGKMAVYLMAKDEGYELELEQMKQQSIDKVTEPLGGVKTIVANAADTSKEKLKELVAQEQKEKAEQQKTVNQTTGAKPTPTSNVSKPVKPDKPIKPDKAVSTETDNSKETDKPGRNGTWVKKPSASPGISNNSEGKKKDAIDSWKDRDRSDDDNDDDDSDNESNSRSDDRNDDDNNNNDDDDDDDRNNDRSDSKNDDKKDSSSDRDNGTKDNNQNNDNNEDSDRNKDDDSRENS